MQRANLKNTTRILRKAMTPWESKLWYFLRGNRFLGFKFKRQVPIGKYIVDFCCQEKKLIIELDGGQHNQGRQIVEDLERQKYLEGHGYKILRFWNNEVDNNLEGVLRSIEEALGTTSLPTSPHLLGRGVNKND